MTISNQTQAATLFSTLEMTYRAHDLTLLEKMIAREWSNKLAFIADYQDINSEKNSATIKEAVTLIGNMYNKYVNAV